MVRTFENVTDCAMILQHGESMLFLAKHPWIFTKDGQFIARLKQINRSWNVLFMPNNTVFMDGLGDQSYHYVSLETGEVLWSIPQKGKRNLTPRKMVLSPCGRKVYYVYSVGEGRYLDTIIPEDKICLKQKFEQLKGAVCSAFWTNEGKLGLLCCFLETSAIHLFDPDDVQKEHAILEIINNNNVLPVAANDTYILLSNLQVINWRDNTTFSLLPDLATKIKRDSFSIMGYDQERQLLNIQYHQTLSTLIIDCKNKKIVSHYRPITSDLTGGCLVGDEFWIGTDEGIQKCPFPHIDPYPRNFFIQE